MSMRSVVLSLAAAILAVGCATPRGAYTDGLKLNQIQVLGTHNSYAQPVDPRLLAIVDPMVGQIGASMTARMSPEQRALFAEEHPSPASFAEGLAYDHPPLRAQLDAGLRSLEIDVYRDPAGGRFLDPAGYRALAAKGIADPAPHDRTGLDQPGFKVLHIPDVDVRSHCPTLETCLGEIRAWSNANPGHTPLFMLLEAKATAFPLLPNATQVVPFDAVAFDALDAALIEGLGRDRLITPDDVRGSYPTLEAAVRAGAWPTLAAARGKVIVLMLTATGPGATNAYLAGHPNLEGRMAFVRANPGERHAAFLLLDNAIVRGEEIAQRVREGYLVRTRADIETWEAKTNDLTRAEAAFASGAQVVSTDFFKPGNAFGTNYFVTLPGGGDYRCNPVNAERRC